MYKLIIIAFLFSKSAFPLAGENLVPLMQISMNTLNSLRDLNQILTEQREFGENFERINQKVEQAVWKADRTIMWIEDIKSLKDVEIENIDDLNRVLSSLKRNASFLRSKLKENTKNKNETKEKIKRSRIDEKRSVKRYKSYTRGVKSGLSPGSAQIETAKNTKDLVVETALLNAKLAKLSTEMMKLTKLNQDRIDRELEKEIADKKKLKQLSRGIIKPWELK